MDKPIETETDIDPLLAAAAKRNPLEQLSPDAKVETLAEMLRDCKAHDAAARHWKACITALEKEGIPPDSIWALLFTFLEEYACGVLPPNMTGVILHSAEKEWGAKRNATVDAAQRAGIIRGDKPSEAVKNRIAEAEKALGAVRNAKPMSDQARAYALWRHEELRRILLLLVR